MYKHKEAEGVTLKKDYSRLFIHRIMCVYVCVCVGSSNHK